MPNRRAICLATVDLPTLDGPPMSRTDQGTGNRLSNAFAAPTERSAGLRSASNAGERFARGFFVPQNDDDLGEAVWL